MVDSGAGQVCVCGLRYRSDVDRASGFRLVTV